MPRAEVGLVAAALVAAAVTGGIAAPMTTAAPGAGSMWINPHDIPGDSVYHWPNLAASAHQATSPMFAFEQACGSTPESWRANIGEGGSAAQVARFGDDYDATTWHGQQIIFAAPGAGDDSVNSARNFSNSLYNEMAICSNTPNGGPRISITWQGEGGGNTPLASARGMAAVFQHSPIGELHDYLVLSSCNNSGVVSELALWAGQPAQSWSAPSDEVVLGAINSALCGRGTGV